MTTYSTVSNLVQILTIIDVLNVIDLIFFLLHMSAHLALPSSLSPISWKTKNRKRTHCKTFFIVFVRFSYSLKKNEGGDYKATMNFQVIVLSGIDRSGGSFENLTFSYQIPMQIIFCRILHKWNSSFDLIPNLEIEESIKWLTKLILHFQCNATELGKIE